MIGVTILLFIIGSLAIPTSILVYLKYRIRIKEIELERVKNEKSP